MLEFDRMDESRGNDVKKAKESSRYIICKYYCFLRLIDFS